MVINPKLVNEILIKKFNHFRENEFSKIFNPQIDPLFSRSPFLARDEKWKEYRSEISTAFSSNRLKTMYPIMESIVENLHTQIINHINHPFEARQLALRFTADIVSNCIFNLNSDCLSGASNVQRMSKLLSVPPKKTVFFMILAEIFPALRGVLPMKFITDDVEEFFLNFFERAMRLRKRNGIKVNDFLDYIITLREQKNLSHEDVAGHLTTFFSDGLETTSLLIAHTLFEVGLYLLDKGTFIKFLNFFLKFFFLISSPIIRGFRVNFVKKLIAILIFTTKYHMIHSMKWLILNLSLVVRNKLLISHF